MRTDWKAGTLVYPLPALLVSCAYQGISNIFTASWTGTMCTDPPMVYVSIRPERYSFDLIRSSMEFALNLTTVAMAKETDWCGVVSGAKYNKWDVCNFTREKARYIQCDLIAEAPLSLECRVRQILPLGSHHAFIAEVLNVRANSDYIDAQTGTFDMQKAQLLSYAHGEYFALGDFLGYFGWSIKKNNAPERRRLNYNSEK